MSTSAPGRLRRGGAALEFMLVLPAVMLVLVGMLAIGNYLTTRYHLSSAAGHAARACSLATNNVGACVQAVATARLPGYVQSRCPGWTVTSAITPIHNGEVNVLNVTVTCTYTPEVGAAFLQGEGITLAQIVGQGSMPLNQ